MKELLNYYYGFDLFDYMKVSDGYLIMYKGKKYHFYRINNLSTAYRKKELLRILEKNVYMNSLIKNRMNSLFTYDGNNYYAMFRINVDFNKKINFNEIVLFYQLINGSKVVDKKDFKYWIELWSNKIDYLERFLNKYYNSSFAIMCIANYYIGMGENAIEYLRLYMTNYNSEVFTAFLHNRINISNFLFDLYNPFNIVVDSKTRDISEYIKSLCFNKKEMQNIIKNIIQRTNFSEAEYVLLVARVVFPTFFFDIFETTSFDNVLSNNKILEWNDYIFKYEELINLVIDNINNIKKTNLVRFDWVDKVNQFA